MTRSLSALSSQTSQFVWVRPAVLLALLFGEGLALGIAFDAESLRQLPHGWWAPLLYFVGRAMPLGATIGLAIVLVALPRIRTCISRHPFPLTSAWPFLVLHLVAYAVLFELSRQLFGATDTVVRGPGPWVIAWCAAVMATISFWALTVLPIAGVRALLLQSGWQVPAGLLAGLAAFAAGLAAQHGWALLRGGTLFVAFALLRVIEPSAYVDANAFILGTSRFSVEVAPECSGYEGIGLVIIFVGIQLWLRRSDLRFPRALLLVPIAIVAVWLANSFRIAALVEVGAHVSPDVAVSGFHSYIGVLLFLGVALGTTAIADQWPFFARSAVARAPLEANPAAPWLVPFLAVLAAGVVTGLFDADGLDRLYPVRLAVGAGALWWYWRNDRCLAARPSLVGVATGVLVFGMWLATAHLIAGVVHRVAGQPGALWLACRVFGFTLVTPVVEELAFRGFLARRLVSREFDSVPYRKLGAFPVLISSAAYGALHGRLALPAFLAGLAYVGVARFRGRLADAVLAHACTNSLLSAYAILAGSQIGWI